MVKQRKVKYKNEAFLEVGKYVCLCHDPIGIFNLYLNAFCEVAQRKQKRVVCLMANQ